MALVASNITYESNGRKILDNISLSLIPGELLALLGPNGSGKSTLLKILCGGLKPTKGSVILDGTSIHKIQPEELSSRRSVFSQESTLGFPYLVEEVVRLGRSSPSLLLPKAREDAVVEWALDQTEIDSKLRHLPFPSISGGEKQRSHFARILVQDADFPFVEKYVFLDEPGANLDPNRQHSVLELAVDLSRRGRGVLIVLHDLNLALRYANRVIVLKSGNLSADGIPEQVLDEEFIRSHFELETLKVPFPGGIGSYLIQLGTYKKNLNREESIFLNQGKLR
ncbi:ABC transporter [Leptospira perolatii]|uniref:ABC transporter n=1 Tax=Leptospira perolatii TaxID=2023191 RepID=A0A2M9ZK75_9LEPT|nr:ATP-binding cassette domain-containing protein [Leptospira perolatii]PJZ69327.1 ABC transporter [Leptospira perolatii]PJZ72462.1 ABC transporter [Leptospira perolatii]